MKIPVAILGCTGLVGQKYCELLYDHPFFEVTYVAASPKSQGIQHPILQLPIGAVDSVPPHIQLIFSALPSSEKAVEQSLADRGAYVLSSSSAYRSNPFVPVVIPEVNGDHLDILSTDGGIFTKPNCTVQGVVLPLFPLLDFTLKGLTLVTMQALSGAGKNAPSLSANIIPYIHGEEQKLEQETKKLLGFVKNGAIIDYDVDVSAMCARVPVLHGHLTQIHATFEKAITTEEIIERWNSFSGVSLPSAPDKPVHYLTGLDRPQPLLDVNTSKGMAVSVGRLQQVNPHTVKMTTLSHNIVRGAAGGGILTAELLYTKGILHDETKSKTTHASKNVSFR